MGKDGKVIGVTIPSGETLDADMVVAGVGKCVRSCHVVCDWELFCRCCASHRLLEGLWTTYDWAGRSGGRQGKEEGMEFLFSDSISLSFFFQFMKATDSVFAAGDIVRFPLPLIDGETNIGHWQIAHNHGQFSITL